MTLIWLKHEQNPAAIPNASSNNQGAPLSVLLSNNQGSPLSALLSNNQGAPLSALRSNNQGALQS